MAGVGAYGDEPTRVELFESLPKRQKLTILGLFGKGFMAYNHQADMLQGVLPGFVSEILEEMALEPRAGLILALQERNHSGRQSVMMTLPVEMQLTTLASMNSEEQSKLLGDQIAEHACFLASLKFPNVHIASQG